MDDSSKLGIAIIVITFIAILYTMKDEEKFSTVKKDFSNPHFVIAFIIIFTLSIIGLTSKEHKIKNATTHAVIAFMIAYMAHLGMPFLVFFIVGLFVYYTNESNF